MIGIKSFLRMKLYSKLERKSKKMDEKRLETHYIIKKVFKKSKLLGAICKGGNFH